MLSFINALRICSTNESNWHNSWEQCIRLVLPPGGFLSAVLFPHSLWQTIQPVWLISLVDLLISLQLPFITFPLEPFKVWTSPYSVAIEVSSFRKRLGAMCGAICFKNASSDKKKSLSHSSRAVVGGKMICFFLSNNPTFDAESLVKWGWH